MLNIGVKELEDATEYLNEKKDELINTKQTCEIKNEELKKELAAKEEINAKRLQAKLNRDKNADVKELIAHEETAIQHNEELALKLSEEIKKFDGLLDDKLEIEEHLHLSQKHFDEIKAKVIEEDAIIK